jgi:hypothetical protein
MLMSTWNAEAEILATTEDIYWTCPEDPARLRGLPLGMYHCPHCGCMVIAGMEGHPHDVHCWLGLGDLW